MKKPVQTESSEFTAALLTFNVCERELNIKKQAHDDTAARLLQARMDAAGVAGEIDKITQDADAGLTDFARLASRQAGTDALIKMLESAVESSGRRLAQCKVDLVAAERECLAIQARHFRAVLAELLAGFARSHAAELQRLVQISRADGLFSLTEQHGAGIAQQFAGTNIRQVIEHDLADAAWLELGDDEKFVSGCALTDEAIMRPVLSAALTDSERTAARSGADAVLKLAEVAPEPPFNLLEAKAFAREAAQRAEGCNQALEDARRQLAREPKDADVIAQVQRLEAAARRADEIMDLWDGRIERYRSQQESQAA